MPESNSPEAAAAIKEMNSYAKQLAEALESSTRAMQKMSDLGRAIKDQNEEMVKHVKTQTEQREKANVANTDAMRAVAQTLLQSEELNETGEKWLQILDDQLRKEAELFEIRSKMGKDTAHKAQRTIEHNKALEEQISLFHKIGETASHAYDKMVLKSQILQGIGMAGSTVSHAFTGKSSGSEGMASILGSITSIIPLAGGLGGLLGFMLAGKMKEAEFTAVGHTAAQQFDQIGGKVAGFAAQLGSASRELSVRGMAGKDDLASVSKAFAMTGVSAQEAAQSIKGFSVMGFNNLAIAALAADKALELPAGTFAQLSGILSTNFNKSAKDAFESLVGMGNAAQSAGLNASVFMHQVMEASGALRMMNANADVVASKMQLDFYNQQSGGRRGDRFASQYAAAGTQQAMQGIAGMNVGLSAVIGEELGMGSGLDAWYAMKSGSSQATNQRGGQYDVAKIAGKLAEIAKRQSNSRSEQVYFLEQMGFGVQGAETILDVGGKAANGQKLSQADYKQLTQGIMSESKKTSSMVLHLDTIKNYLTHIATGFLSMIVEMLKVLVHGIQWIMAYFEGGKSGAIKMAGHEEAMSDGLGNVSKSAIKFGSNLKGLFKELGSTAGEFGLSDGLGLGSKYEQQLLDVKPKLTPYDLVTDSEKASIRERTERDFWANFKPGDDASVADQVINSRVDTSVHNLGKERMQVSIRVFRGEVGKNFKPTKRK